MVVKDWWVLNGYTKGDFTVRRISDSDDKSYEFGVYFKGTHHKSFKDLGGAVKFLNALYEGKYPGADNKKLTRVSKSYKIMDTRFSIVSKNLKKFNGDK